MDFIFDGPDTADATILLAHGAGAPMDSAGLTRTVAALAGTGLRIARFEFGYMNARRAGVGRKPPPRADKLNPEYIAAVDELSGKGPLIIGGKSMGGRVASMVADDLFASGQICGLLCLGYPFHPPAKPEQVRTKHLLDLQTPTLIVQGTLDPFGTREDVAGYNLASSIDILWIEDGDHDLEPRKSVAGQTFTDHLTKMAAAVSAWAERVTAR